DEDGIGVSNKQVDKERQSIETLPEEIFVNVIQLYASSCTPAHHLTTATLVCRRWRTVVEGTPFLWGKISGEDRLHRIRKALELSGGVPLDLEYDEKTSEIKPGAFFREIGPHIARWRTIVAQFHSKDFPLFELETLRAPILKKLHFVCIYGWQAKRPTLFGGRPAPTTLEDFKIAGIPLSLDLLHLSGLKELRIIRHATLTSAMALVVLRNSPELEVLELNGFKATDSLKSDQDAIQLPSLNHIIIDEIPLELAEWLLLKLSLPSLQRFSLSLDFEERPPRILPLLDPHIPELKRVVSGASSINVKFTGDFYGISIGELDLLFGSELDKNDVLAGELFEWLVSSFGKGLANIPVNLCLSDCPPSHVLAGWLSSRVKVTRLEVWSDPYFGVHSMDDVISALASPSGSSSSSRWTLPFLEELDGYLVWKGDNQDLVDHIRARQRAGMPSRSKGGEGTIGAPEPLKEIWLRYAGKGTNRKPPLDENFIESMREAAGDAKLYWIRMGIADTKFDSASYAEAGPSDFHSHSTKGYPYIEEIPEDLFIDVIRLYASPLTPVLDLTTATLVCQRWRSVVKGTPFLWSKISGAESLPRIRKGLKLSGDVPLDLDYDQASSNIKAADFFKEAGPHISRWRTVVAHFHSTNFSFSELETSQAPALEKLHLVYDGWSVWNKTLTLFGGLPAPFTLQNVRIEKTPVSLEPLHLSRLKNLILSGNLSIPPAILPTLLQSSPELEVLSLSDLYGLNISEQLDQVAVQLPLLKELVIHKIPLQLAQWLLSTFSAPTVRRFTLCLDVGESIRNPILSLLDSHAAALKSAATNASLLGVAFHASYYDVSIGNLELSFESSLDSKEALARELVEWLFTTLGEGSTHLPADLRLSDCPPGEVLAEWLSSRINVTRVRVWNNPWDGMHLMDQVISALASPHPSSATGWVLPSVETLETNLVSEEGNPHLVESIRARQRAAMQDPQADVTIGAPKLLREIWLWYGGKKVNRRPAPNEKFMRSVRDAGGDAELSWCAQRWGAG
ncbi:hypothetical protein FRB90_004831, partial [Tulasnella sp. 427]